MMYRYSSLSFHKVYVYFDGLIVQNFNLETIAEEISIALFEVIRILARDFAGCFLVHSTYHHLRVPGRLHASCFCAHHFSVYFRKQREITWC